MDSSICLAHAIREFGVDQVLTLGFHYGQRHSEELQKAKKICSAWGVDRKDLRIDCLSEITENALINSEMPIESVLGGPPNTLVVGRNGLMARIAGIHANHLGLHRIYMGVIEVESANSGYRDCSRSYMDLMQEILRIDFADPMFEICTPVIKMTKCQTLELAHELGVLNYLLDTTITCYEGLQHLGCAKCPACVLRNEGIAEFALKHPKIPLPYSVA